MIRACGGVARRITPLTLAVVLALGSAAFAQPATLDTLNVRATVYAYGHELSPPFTWTWEGGVLTLNGYPFCPTAALPSAPPDTSRLASIRGPLREMEAARGPLRARAIEAINAAGTKADALEAARLIFASSPAVSSARSVGSGLMVVYVALPDAPFEESFEFALGRFDPVWTFAVPPTSPPHSRPAEARNLDEIVAHGGIFAFGSGYIVKHFGDCAAVPLRHALADTLVRLSEISTGDSLVVHDARHPVPLGDLRASLHLPMEVPTR
ncbi:MAG: hypothetical protein U0167_07925 [bacterium]